MFGTRIRVTATAVAGLSPVRARGTNARAAPAPRGLLGAVTGLNAARGLQ
jgi:hypothetical protein